jgi:hypothetical protein
MDHYEQYLRTLELVRKAQRRGDVALAERWARVAKSWFNARVWGDKIDREEGVAMRRVDEARLDAVIRRKRAEAKRQEFLRRNPHYLGIAPHLAGKCDDPPEPGERD